jgi:hypothetical protein
LIALAIAALAIAALAIVASVLVGVLTVGVRLAVVNRSSGSMSRPSIVFRDSRDALSWEYFFRCCYYSSCTPVIDTVSYQLGSSSVGLLVALIVSIGALDLTSIVSRLQCHSCYPLLRCGLPLVATYR